MILHAGLIAAPFDGQWRGALVEGPSGAGKSDLTLRALALGFAIVSDDQTLVWPCEGRLYGRCPPSIAGLIEVRGLGVAALPSARRMAQVRLIVDCRPPEEDIERLPDPERRRVLGVETPVLRLHALEPSAPIKLRLALSRIGSVA